MVNAFRYGFLGSSDVDVGLAFVITLARQSSCLRSW
jgi:hypothetical protein